MNLSKGGGELIGSLLEGGLNVGVEGLLGLDLLKNRGVVGLNVLEPASLELTDALEVDGVKVATHTGEDNNDLLVDRHRLVLALLEELLEAGTTVKLVLGGGIEIGTELSEGSDLTVLGKLELDGTGNLLHGLDLSGGTDTGDGETDVHGGADTLVEELGLEEDLAVSDRNNVGGNVSGHITSLGLNHGEGGEGTSAEVVRDLGGTLEETRVQVEDVTGVSLTAGGAAEEEGHLTVGNSLLGQVIVEDDGVGARVAEVLTDGGTGVGGEVLEGSRVGGGGSDDNAEGVSAVLLELGGDLGDGGALLADSDVHTVELLGLISLTLVEGLLVDDGVDGNGGLTGLTITNDELTLATANGDEGVDGLETSLHGLVHGLTGKNTRGLDLDTVAAVTLDGALAVDGLTEGVDGAAEEVATDGHVDDGTGTLDDVTLEDETIVTEDHNTNVVVLKVESHTLNASVHELNHLTGLDLVEAEDTGDTVTNGDDVANLVNRDTGALLVVAGDTVLEDAAELSGADGEGAGTVEGDLGAGELHTTLGEGGAGREPRGGHKTTACEAHC
mmetsp:Transcript_14605/g.28280  ORF Transcript_14605/g.28280 Transcript_14605/m.28280 type:complete len:558 (-) Transcript_14605:55-1728(-)